MSNSVIMALFCFGKPPKEHWHGFDYSGGVFDFETN